MTFLHRMTLKKHKMTWHSVALACHGVPRRTLNLISTEHYNMKKHSVLYLYRNFQLRVESNPWLLWFCLISLHDWSRKLTARSQPIRFDTKTNAIWSLSLLWLALNRTPQWTQNKCLTLYDVIQFCSKDVVLSVEIRQILLHTSDWSKCITRPNIPRLKLGDIRYITQVIFRIFQASRPLRYWSLPLKFNSR